MYGRVDECNRVLLYKKISGLLEELVDSPPCHGGYTAGSSPVQLASFKADLAQLVEHSI